LSPHEEKPKATVRALAQFMLVITGSETDVPPSSFSVWAVSLKLFPPQYAREDNHMRHGTLRHGED
jgi:hypothetical protein